MLQLHPRQQSFINTSKLLFLKPVQFSPIYVYISEIISTKTILKKTQRKQPQKSVENLTNLKFGIHFVTVWKMESTWNSNPRQSKLSSLGVLPVGFPFFRGASKESFAFILTILKNHFILFNCAQRLDC